MSTGKIIITCAVTGATHTPTMSPYLPATPKDIADQAVGAAEAGAAIVHLHARRESDGMPTGDIDTWLTILHGIKSRSNVVANMTTGGSTYMKIEDRLAAPMVAKPELTSMNMGSMNFGTFTMAKKFSNWKHDWELPFLEDSRDAIFRNTFRDIEVLHEKLGEGCGARFEYECYDVGHLYTLKHFLDRGIAKPPLFVQMVLGSLGGIGADPENLMHMKATADRLFGSNYLFSVLCGGRLQMRMTTMAAIVGGNVRVGMEDSLYLGKGELAKSNAEAVARIRTTLESLGMEIATPDEARARLGLKGIDRVAY
ncbi:MAG: 3-keto-5-aminohexanoate cleavage protein [Burkholderiales bacterium]